MPIALGYLSVSFTFGMMAVEGGLPVFYGGAYLYDKFDLGRSVCRA
ncbi:MAG: hypothetical protein ACLSE9_06465 [Acutalibacteraceae bacterium]